MFRDEYNDFVRRRPFRPYRLHLSDGRTYDVDHPDMAAVGFGAVMLFVLTEDNGNEYQDVLISLLHIVQIEYIRIDELGQVIKPISPK